MSRFNLSVHEFSLRLIVAKEKNMFLKKIFFQQFDAAY